MVSATLDSPNDGGPSAKQAYLFASACLFLGLIVGYFFLGTHRDPSAVARTTGRGAPTNAPVTYGRGHPQMTLDQMKQMADVQASALIDKSKSDPKNAAVLFEIASIYQASHQFKQAAGYFEKGLQFDPKNVPARTQLASCLYYSGETDGALSQLAQALKYNPKDANALFNLGMIKYRGKNDPAGAVAAWHQLLKSNPDLDRKPIVEQMITEAEASTKTADGGAIPKGREAK